MSGVDFLRHYYHRDCGFSAGERARNDFKRDERARVWRNRDEAGENRVAEDRVEQQTTAPEYVGEGRHQQR